MRFPAPTLGCNWGGDDCQAGYLMRGRARLQPGRRHPSGSPAPSGWSGWMHDGAWRLRGWWSGLGCADCLVRPRPRLWPGDSYARCLASMRLGDSFPAVLFVCLRCSDCPTTLARGLRLGSVALGESLAIWPTMATPFSTVFLFGGICRCTSSLSCQHGSSR